jgi:hypothetical protein
MCSRGLAENCDVAAISKLTKSMMNDLSDSNNFLLWAGE